MIEGVELTVSYAPVADIRSICIIIEIASSKGLIIFVLDIPNAIQNNILPNPAEIVYLGLPYLYLNWYKRKCPKHPLASGHQKELCI